MGDFKHVRKGCVQPRVADMASGSQNSYLLDLPTALTNPSNAVLALREREALRAGRRDEASLPFLLWGLHDRGVCFSVSAHLGVTLPRVLGRAFPLPSNRLTWGVKRAYSNDSVTTAQNLQEFLGIAFSSCI